MQNAVRKEKSYIDTFKVLNDRLKAVYKDPQAAAVKIEQTIFADKGDKLPDILDKDPARAGDLRGSDRLIDRFKTVGKERKEALCNVPFVISTLRELQSFYKNSYEQNKDQFTREREQLKVEVPSLSKDSVRYMKDVAAGRETYLNIPEPLNKEFLHLPNALDKRFGQDALDKRDFDLSKAIPAKQPHDKKLVREFQRAVEFLQQRHVEEQNSAIVQVRLKGIVR
ncbi:BID domain-containing protein [Bartonella machadoae]|uniref:BID domain-containing protein n=1 Tax=Bartonella machadoae TaxID=2893471 RepID=UPI001F4CF4D8|nr:BID domain-containing protein [Bartonella machadoae]UNE53889.1 BID domain-containing protein [Bartonella machadoae]